MSIYEDARRTVAHPPETCTDYEAIFAREVVRLTEVLQRIIATGSGNPEFGDTIKQPPPSADLVVSAILAIAVDAIGNERTADNDT